MRILNPDHPKLRLALELGAMLILGPNAIGFIAFVNYKIAGLMMAEPVPVMIAAMSFIAMGIALVFLGFTLFELRMKQSKDYIQAIRPRHR